MLVVMADEGEAMDVIEQLGNLRERNVVVARSVAEGWRMFDPSIVSGVIIDAVLPDGSGVDLYRWIAARCPGFPVMILAGSDDELPSYAELRDGRVVVKADVDESRLRPAPPVPTGQSKLN